jgi:hypothetical protein
VGVLDGQPVSAAITNPAFINKNQDDTMANKLSFARALSGSSIDDIQAAVNKLYDATGASESTTGTVYNAPANTITDGDSHETALTDLADKFHPVTGHQHTGAAGDAPPISGQYITDVPLLQITVQGTTLTAVTGNTWNVTTQLTGETASTGITDPGIVVTAPYNKVFIANGQASPLTDSFVDSSGNLVYARLTESLGTWTLSFYSLVFGVETPYSFTGSTNILWYYKELFEPLVDTPVYEPTYADLEFRTVKSIAASGFSPPLFGEVVVSASGGVSVFQSGQNLIFTGSLSDDYPQDVAATGNPGVSDRAARSDHAHQGIHSFSKFGDTALYGDVTVSAASGVVATQTGQDIQFFADHYDTTPEPVTATPSAGVSLELARGDHSHEGIHSVAASGNSAIYGDAVFQAASGAVVSQSGQNILYSVDFSDTTPADVTATPSAGVSLEAARGDHSHEGVHSIAASGFSPSLGDVTLIAGTGMAISATGNNIEFQSTVVGGVTSIAASGYPPATGDITLVAGTNITITQIGDEITIASSGGGTASPLTTKGDLYGYDTDNARVPVGASGTFLSADPNTALGVRYRDEYLRNFILEDDAEIGTTAGYATYANAAGTSPVDGTGGSPNITFAVTGSNPISRSNSYLITKDAANRQGQGVSYDFPIDNSMKGQVVEISFDYEPGTNWVASSGGLDFSDVAVYMYDVTNSILLPVQPAVMTTGAGYVGTFVGSFQTNTTTANLRLIWHIATTNANAWTFKFDNVRVGKPVRTQGTPVTDWVSYTPDFVGSSNGLAWSNATTTGRWRRVGDSMQIQVATTFSGAPGTGTGSFRWGIPSFAIVDTAKIPNGGSSNYTSLGTVNAIDTGTAFKDAHVLFAGTTQVAVIQDGDVDSWGPTRPFTWASGDGLGMQFFVPIAGWSSQVEMSTQAATTVVAMTALSQTPTGSLGATDNIVIFGTISKDTNAAYSTITGLYTILVSGWYELEGGLDIGHASVSINNVITASIKKNGSTEIARSGILVSNTSVTEYAPQVGGTGYFTAGDTIGLYSLTNGTSPSYVANIASSHLSIKRVSGPATIAASEKLAPTIQRFTSGSGTYTTPTLPARPLYSKVKMVGGGGGGSSSGANSGGNGGDTTFGSSFLTAGGGVGGANGAGGAGGTNTINAGGTTVVNVSGGGGETGIGVATASVNAVGGSGGNSFFGGGAQASGFNSTGFAGGTNTGGGGGGASAGANTNGGSGGGAGGYIEVIISSIASSYSYSVGAAGTAGSGSGNAGGAGGSGVIIVEEYYQ